MNNQIALAVKRQNENSLNKIDSLNEVVNYSINEIDHHIQYKTKVDNIKSLINLDQYSRLLSYLRPLERDNQEVYQLFRTLFIDSSKKRTNFSESLDCYTYILYNIKMIKRKLDNFPSLVRSVEDFDITAVNDCLKSVNIDDELASFRTNLKNFIEKIDCIKIDNHEQVVDLKSYIGTQSSLLESFISMEKKIQENEENLAKFSSELLDISNKMKNTTANIENIYSIVDCFSRWIKLEKTNQKNIEERIKIINEEKNKIVVQKIETLNNSEEKSKLKEKNEWLHRQRLDQEQKNIETMNKIKSEQADLINDINSNKIFTKINHLIFVLDESGSMSGIFELVKTSVLSIIEKRRNIPSTNEKVSVIKFNDNATIETLNADIRENVEIGKMRGGGTSFVSALSKIEEVMQEINYDRFIPLIFFLSDGFSEPKNKVLKKCNELLTRFQNYDILFFAVGFGNADKQILEKMTNVFNRGNSVLKIGEERCKLYYSADNTQELERAFTIFNKLFDYQKNSIRFKQEMFDKHLDYITCCNERHNNEFNKMHKQNQKLYDKSIEEAKKNAVNLDDINNVCDQHLAELNTTSKEIGKKIVELTKEKNKHDENLAELNAELEILETQHSQKKLQYEEKSKNVRELEINEEKKLMESLRNVDGVHEENLDKIIKEFEGLGVTPNNEFRRIIKNLQKDYENFEKNTIELSSCGGKIKSYFKYLIFIFDEFTQDFENLQNLVNQNSFNLDPITFKKILSIITEEIKENVSFEEALELILKKPIRTDRKKQEFDESFKLLESIIPLKKLVRNILSPTESKKMLKLIDDKEEELETKKNDKKEELEKKQDNEGDLNDTKITESIDNLKEELKEATDEYKYLKKHKTSLNKIMDDIIELVRLAKAKYIRENIMKQLRETYYMKIKNYAPQLNNRQLI